MALSPRLRQCPAAVSHRNAHESAARIVLPAIGGRPEVHGELSAVAESRPEFSGLPGPLILRLRRTSPPSGGELQPPSFRPGHRLIQGLRENLVCRQPSIVSASVESGSSAALVRLKDDNGRPPLVLLTFRSGCHYGPSVTPGLTHRPSKPNKPSARLARW